MIIKKIGNPPNHYKKFLAKKNEFKDLPTKNIKKSSHHVILNEQKIINKYIIQILLDKDDICLYPPPKKINIEFNLQKYIFI